MKRRLMAVLLFIIGIDAFAQYEIFTVYKDWIVDMYDFSSGGVGIVTIARVPFENGLSACIISVERQKKIAFIVLQSEAINEFKESLEIAKNWNTENKRHDLIEKIPEKGMKAKITYYADGKEYESENLFLYITYDSERRSNRINVTSNTITLSEGISYYLNPIPLITQEQIDKWIYSFSDAALDDVIKRIMSQDMM